MLVEDDPIMRGTAEAQAAIHRECNPGHYVTVENNNNSEMAKQTE